MRSTALALALAVVLCGCDCAPDTRVTVFVDAQRGARSAATRLRMRVIATDGSVRLDDVREIDASTAWPLRLPLVPEGGTADRTWAVEATLTDAEGVVVAIARGRGGYVVGARREAGLCLADGCADEACGASDACSNPEASCATCIGGGCLDATAELTAPGTAPRCPPADCVPSGFRETVCGDGVDDDCDGRADCLDAECGCDAGACTFVEDENTLTTCHDGIDNDCDGRIDCEEGTACVFSEGPDRCDDAIDDDCDGATDCLDDACCEAPICAQEACGGGGLRCCDGRCVNTWADTNHCGACGNACRAPFACSRVSGPDDMPVRGATCRCGTAGATCLSGGTCERHNGALACNCDTDCRGRAECVDQPGDLHSYCRFP